MCRARHEASELFIFSGHGGGEAMCDSRRLRRISCPSAWLWGCSSGRLLSHGVHDPCGLALSYLLSSPSSSSQQQRQQLHVIGSLWDVTDRDIDKLSQHFMAAVLPSTLATDSDHLTSASESTCLALIRARSACKMKYAVGSAPVVYGLPSRLG